MLKKSFQVPYEENVIYPSFARTMIEIIKYCKEKGMCCNFISDQEVEIDGEKYEIHRNYQDGQTGKYNIECVEI